MINEILKQVEMCYKELFVMCKTCTYNGKCIIQITQKTEGCIFGCKGEHNESITSNTTNE